jgi:hypothetical protein
MYVHNIDQPCLIDILVKGAGLGKCWSGQVLFWASAVSL